MFAVNPRHHSAQSLLEAVIAIGIIVAAVMGSTTLIVSPITSGQNTQDNIVAINFAREGVEIVRGIRDSNWLKRSDNVQTTDTTPALYDWDTGFATSCPSGNCVAVFTTSSGWSLHDATNAVQTISQNGDSFTQFANADDAAGCTSCIDTKYSRVITIATMPDTFTYSSNPVATTYLLVTSKVVWFNHGDKSLTVSERLYNWR